MFGSFKPFSTSRWQPNHMQSISACWLHGSRYLAYGAFSGNMYCIVANTNIFFLGQWLWQGVVYRGCGLSPSHTHYTPHPVKAGVPRIFFLCWQLYRKGFVGCGLQWGVCITCLSSSLQRTCSIACKSITGVQDYRSARGAEHESRKDIRGTMNNALLLLFHNAASSPFFMNTVLKICNHIVACSSPHATTRYCLSVCAVKVTTSTFPFRW